MGTSVEQKREASRRRNALWRERHREALRIYQREYMRERRAADPERARRENREQAQRYRENDRDADRKRNRDWYHRQTLEKKRARAALLRLRNKETIRAAAKRWSLAHPEKKNAETAKRRARQMRAMPAWVDQKALAAVYAERQRLERETGHHLHVDHIVPLAGKTVCGLHVPWNLQIIPAIENIRKSNKLLAVG